MGPSFVSWSDNGNIHFFIDVIVAPFGIITDESIIFLCWIAHVHLGHASSDALLQYLLLL